MALIVSQSLASSDPLDQTPIKAVGISLPIVRSSTGYFRQTFTTSAAIRIDLMNLLLTKIGERPLNPEFGSRLYSLVFQQQGPNLESEADDAVRSAVRRWLPQVIIDDVSIQEESGEPNIYSLRINITYSVPNVVGLSDLTLLVEA